MNKFGHFANSAYVAGWGWGEDYRPDVLPDTQVELGEQFRLQYKEEGCHDIEVSFFVVKNFPDMMHIHSRNYRCENEPHGLYKKDSCRKFYNELIRRGFQKCA